MMLKLLAARSLLVQKFCSLLAIMHVAKVNAFNFEQISFCRYDRSSNWQLINKVFKEIKLLNSVVLEIALVSYLQKFYCMSFKYCSLLIFIGCCSNSLLIVFVVGFNNLSCRQKNIRSKFKFSAKIVEKVVKADYIIDKAGKF